MLLRIAAQIGNFTAHRARQRRTRQQTATILETRDADDSGIRLGHWAGAIL
jgi:hypothetical protein